VEDAVDQIREHQGSDGSEAGKQQTLGQDHPYQPAGPRTEGRPDRELRLTAGNSREQQVGNVGADDQEDTAYDTRQESLLPVGSNVNLKGRIPPWVSRMRYPERHEVGKRRKQTSM
jgi:hypothetical protein